MSFDFDSIFESLSHKSLILGGVVLAILTFSGRILKGVRELIFEWQNMPQHTIIGVVGNVTLPDPLMQLPDFTSMKKLRRSNKHTVIYYARTLSYALRKCDFVLVNEKSFGDDVKIHSANELNFWSAIASKE